MKRLFCGFAICALLLSGCARDVLNTKPEVRGLEGAAPLQTLVDPRTGSDVTLRPGGKLRLELDANATTGYYWVITEIDPEAVTLLSEDYQSDPSPEGMVGVGGTMIFVFEGAVRGKSRLVLSYQRSPEDVAETLKLDLRVTS